MKIIGAVIYLIIQSVITPVFALLMILSILINRRTLPKLLAKYWCKTMLYCGVWFRGVKFKVTGLENIPSTACVILSKHQSEWETLFLPVVLPPHCIVLKHELLKIPFFGWGLKLLEPIAIDRSQKKASLEQVITQGVARLKQGLYVVIFPEGTRVKPGYRGRYAQSGAQLAVKAQVPVIPVAHNAGIYWPKGFFKNPGTIEVRFGTPIDITNKSSAEVNKEVEEWIENNMEQITGEPARSLSKKNTQPLVKKRGRGYTIQINEKLIPYKIIRRKNRKTIGLIMDQEGLSVAIPHWVNINQVEETLRQQQKWVLDRYLTWKNKPKPTQQEWKEGATVPWLGSTKTIQFALNQQLNLFEQNDQFIQIEPTDNDIQSSIIDHYKTEIKKVLEEEINYFSQLLALSTIPPFFVSNAQSRWGSCNNKGELRFNWRLMKASREEIRYVVAHEMAHLFEFNHGPGFWLLVEKIYPDFRQAKERLKKNDALYRQF